jgi:hypothetical protein
VTSGLKTPLFAPIWHQEAIRSFGSSFGTLIAMQSQEPDISEAVIPAI